MGDSEKHEGALVGAVLQDSYRLVRLIGRGAMGEVYEGVHVRLGNTVAVKVMARELAANQEALDRFAREASVTSQIGHPHIVHVFDFGATPGGQPYLVMELLRGEDLDRRLRRVGRLPLPTVVHIVKQAAVALGAAHGRGVVHRDLKPANIFLLDLEGDGDFVKIVDFGISKVRAAATKLTRSSVVMGTPDYMSPEQAQGRSDEIDHRSDQWALAVIAWEMTAGRTPFVGDDVASVLYQVIHEEPPPLGRAGGVPAAFEQALRRALSKRPADRFPTTSAFARSLEAAAAGARPEMAGRAPARSARPGRATLAFDSTERGTRQEPRPARAAAAPTTFSHVTGETLQLAGRGPMERLRPALVVLGVLAFAGVLALLLRAPWGARPVVTTVPAGRPSLPASHPSLARRPSIKQLAAPAFVGPPWNPAEAKSHDGAGAPTAAPLANSGLVDPWADPWADDGPAGAKRIHPPAQKPAETLPHPFGDRDERAPARARVRAAGSEDSLNP